MKRLQRCLNQRCAFFVRDVKQNHRKVCVQGLEGILDESDDEDEADNINEALVYWTLPHLKTNDKQLMLVQ